MKQLQWRTKGYKERMKISKNEWRLQRRTKDYKEKLKITKMN